MRASSLIPLVVLIAANGCGSAPEETGRASTVPARDLTLEPSPSAAVEVASPLEAPRPQPEQPRMHRPRRAPRPALAPDRRPWPPEAVPAAEVVAAPAPAAPAPAPHPAAPTVAADPRALAPGQTVRVIPASSGPSVGSDPAEAPPSRAGRAIMMGGHGGSCRPRGAMRFPR
jgi:hypothetical protein